MSNYIIMAPPKSVFNPTTTQEKKEVMRTALPGKRLRRLDFDLPEDSVVQYRLPTTVVGVAQSAEHRVVVPGVVGSIPITHPNMRP